MGIRKIIIIIALFLVGVASTAGMREWNKRQTKEIESAVKISSGMTVGGFLSRKDGDRAIYTGSISAVDAVSLPDRDETYIKIEYEHEREERIYNEDEDRWEQTTETVSSRTEECKELLLDDVNIPYSKVSGLPKEHKTETSGDDIYKYTYIPSVVDGTFYIQSKDGKIELVTYYQSENVAAENEKTNNGAIGFIWLIIIVIVVIIIVMDAKKRKREKAIEKRKAAQAEREARKKEREAAGIKPMTRKEEREAFEKEIEEMNRNL